MKIQFQLQNGSYSDRVTLDAIEGATVGQVLYRFFNAQIAKIVLGKKRGMLKGVSLRDSWTVSILVDGKVFIDSIEAARGTSLTSFNLKLGTTTRGVERFRQSMCELTVLCMIPFVADDAASFETGFLLNKETIAVQVRDVMKMPTATVAEKLTVASETQTAPTKKGRNKA